MLYPVCSLTVGSLTLDFVHELHIVSSWRDLTDTCTIELPRNLRVRAKGATTFTNLEDVVQVGDAVRVAYGYGSSPAPPTDEAVLRTEFVGYVTELKPGPPIKIVCQDEMYFLKKVSLPSYSWKKASTYDVAKYVRDCSKRDFSVTLLGDKPVNLGAFRIEKQTGAKVFRRLADEYQLHCFFREGKLVIGDPYQARDKPPKRHTLKFGQNIIDNTLQYVNAADVNVQVYAKSLLNNVKRKRDFIDTTVPKPAANAGPADTDAPGGEVRNYTFVGLNQAELEARANAILARLKYTGYTGTVTTFGAPTIEHGDEVHLDDTGAAYPKGGATFSVDKVEKTFGASGSRRVVTLGPLIPTT
jgi:hypothetical protein